MWAYLPLLTVSSVIVLVAHMLFHGRYRRQPHRMLLLFLVFACTYALFVFLYFTAESREDAMLLARVALFANYLAAISLVVFSISLQRPVRRLDVALAIMMASVAIPGWPFIVEGARMESWGWMIIYEYRVAAVYAALTFSLLSFSVWELHLMHKRLRPAKPGLAGRIALIRNGFAIYLVVGLLFNVIFSVALEVLPPLNSIAMMAPISMITYSFIGEIEK